MSASIDQRIVQLLFDNKDFESNAKTSMSTLERLKSGLDLSGVGYALTGVTNKFSALEKIATGALLNIGASIERYLSSTLKSLTVDNLTLGFDKFTENTKNVKTIMSATGKTIDEVSVSMNKLLWFTDETSYSYSDMVNNIGKFVSQGVELETASTAMEGISTWAALSGQGINEASRAMYNLSQALAQGSVKLMDWKSIENANMATAQFKDTAIEAAIQLGTLKRSGDGVAKTLKGVTVSAQTFNTTLADGWFTSEVLLNVLGQYGKAADYLYTATDALGLTATEMLGASEAFNEGAKTSEELARELGVSAAELSPYLEELAKDEYKLGLEALRAAQQSRSLKDVIDATKDAVSSNIMRSLTYIIGNAEEATKVWSRLAEDFYTIFAEGGEARNAMLKQWHNGLDFRREAAGIESVYEKVSGYTELLRALDNVLSFVTGTVETAREAIAEVIPPMTAERLIVLTSKFADLTENLKLAEERFRVASKAVNELGEEVITSVESTEKAYTLWSRIHSIFSGIAAIFSIVGKTISGVFNALKPLIQSLLNVSDDLFGATASLGDWLTAVDENLEKNEIFAGVMEIVGNAAKFLSGCIETLRGAIPENFGGKFINALKTIYEWFNKIIFGSSNLVEWLGKVTSGIQNALFGDGEGEPPILSKMQIIGEHIKTFTNFIGDLLTPAIEYFFDKINNMDMGGAFATLFAGGGILKFIKSFKTVGSLEGLVAGATGALGAFTGVFDKLKEMLGGSDSLADNIKKIATSILILAGAFLVMSFVDTDSLAAVVAAMASLLIIITGFSSLLAENSKMVNQLKKLSTSFIKIGASLLLLAIALAVVVPAFKKLGEFDMETIRQGLLSLVGIFTVFGIFMFAMSQINVKSIKTLGKTMLEIAIALLAVFAAVLLFGMMDLDTLNQGLAAIAVFFIELAVLGAVADKAIRPKTILSIAASLLLISAALLLLIPTLYLLGSMDPGKLAQGVVAIAAIFLVMSALGALTSSEAFSPLKFLGFAAAVLIITAAILLLVPAIWAITSIPIEKMETFALALAVFFAIIIAAGFLAEGAAVGLLALAGAIVLFGAAVLLAGAGVLLFGAGLLLISAGLDALGDGTETTLLTNALLAFAVSLLAVAAAGLVFAVALAAVAIAVALAAVALGVLGVALGIVGVGVLVLAVGILVLAGAMALLNVVVQNSGDMFNQLITFILELTGVTLLAIVPIVLFDAALVGLALAIGLVDLAILGFGATVSWIVGELKGTFLGAILGMNDSVEEGGAEVSNNFEEFANGLPDLIDLPSFSDVGDMIIEALKGALEAGKQSLINTVCGIGTSLLGGFKSVLGIHSPSREFYKAGEFCMIALENSFDDNEFSVVGSAKKVGKSIISAFSDTVSQLGNELSGIDGQPVIRPVLDLSDIQNGVRDLNGMLGDSGYLSISGNIANASIAASGMRTEESGSNVNTYSSSNNTVLNVYPQNLSEAQIDYLYSRFNARLGGAIS